ncbi:cellulose synthase catalytic subunit [filamentous cyanobacterium CCP5]|nr:cellulose synthase catalytic subunit [filamentous cyanobacterium CCP5]
MGLSPQPKPWSRVVMVSILLALTIRYVTWRAVSTLYLDTVSHAIFSVGLFLIELVFIFSSVVQLYLLLKVKFRNRQGDRYQQAVLDGHYCPSVDVLIPTYDEPVAVLRRTIAGCQAMDYAAKTVYLLDDQQRPEIATLALAMGCHYLTRSDNRHAKAGNLNHALEKTQGELVVVFDADFVPSTNFLTRTVGFFQNPRNGLLQTHQSFFSPDPVARNLGLETILTQEVEIFSRYYQVLRDSIDTALCYGSSFVARRAALEAVGGFDRGGLSEDYYTGVKLSAIGYEVIYLNESLSAGLSAENMADHVAQRLRWTRGTLQTLFLEANPLTIPGLTWLQRVAHFEGISQWFGSVFRIFFLLLPGAVLFWDWVPMQLSWQEVMYFMLPFYVVNLSTYRWLNFRSRSVFVSDIYAVAQCFPIALTVLQTLIRPFSKGFEVTPKGHVSNRFVFQWRLALPLLILLPLMVVFFAQGLRLASMGRTELLQMVGDPNLIPTLRVAWIGGLYNLLIVWAALLCLLDVPKPDPHEWFRVSYSARINFGLLQVWGTTNQISEAGIGIVLDADSASALGCSRQPVEVVLPEANISLTGVLVGQQDQTVSIQFQGMSLETYRQLIVLLYCQPGRWGKQVMPSEPIALWEIARAILMPVGLQRFVSRRWQRQTVVG